MLTVVFAIFSVTMVVAIFAGRRFLFFRRFKTGDFETIKKLRVKYFTTCIVTWALAEAIAIYGFVLAILSEDIAHFVSSPVRKRLIFCNMDALKVIQIFAILNPLPPTDRRTPEFVKCLLCPLGTVAAKFRGHPLFVINRQLDGGADSSCDSYSSMASSQGKWSSYARAVEYPEELCTTNCQPTGETGEGYRWLGGLPSGSGCC